MDPRKGDKHLENSKEKKDWEAFNEGVSKFDVTDGHKPRSSQKQMPQVRDGQSPTSARQPAVEVPKLPGLPQIPDTQDPVKTRPQSRTGPAKRLNIKAPIGVPVAKKHSEVFDGESEIPASDSVDVQTAEEVNQPGRESVTSNRSEESRTNFRLGLLSKEVRDKKFKYIEQIDFEEELIWFVRYCICNGLTLYK